MAEDQLTELKRSLSLPLITFYGLGSIIGAGIYVLIGEVAGKAGLYAPIAFLLAAIVAGFTAFSYAELSHRFPVSAGEAKYILEGLRLKSLSILAGWLVIAMGVISSATLARGFVGYFQIFFQLPAWIIILVTVSILGIIAIWGIIESAIAASIITLLEIGGLILVLFAARHSLYVLPNSWHSLFPKFNMGDWSGIFLGSFIAFYAFIGFEDMVNVAEEVKNVEKNLPIAIFLAVIIATLLYLAVAVTAVFALPIHTLGTSKAPLALIVQHSGFSPNLIALISLVAILNGALIQMIMASRVIYGLSREGGSPKFLGKVNRKTKTPIRATILVTFCVLAFALWLPVETLAKTTSYFTLTMFALVNLSLILIKLNKIHTRKAISYPIILPIIGLLLCILLLTVQVLITIGWL